MCLGRKLKAKLAVLRSADRSIQYQTSDPIKIDENNVISLKLDSAVLRINNQGELTLDIPSQGDINSILNHLSNYLPSHSLTDSNIPLITNGAGKAKWATDTIGSDVKPIFLNSGKITESNGNKGSSAKPIYMQNGEFKESSSDLGGATTPIYMQNGELKQGTALNNAAYRDVAASVENTNKLVPVSLLKSQVDTINLSLGIERWVLSQNYKRTVERNSVIIVKASISIYKIYYNDDSTGSAVGDYVILGYYKIENDALFASAPEKRAFISSADLTVTYDDMFPIPEIVTDGGNLSVLSNSYGLYISADQTTKFCIRNKFPIFKSGSWNILS